MAQTKAQLIDGKGAVDLGALSISGSAPDNSVNLDASGRFLVGTSSARTNVFRASSSFTAPIQIDSVTNSYSNGINILNYSLSGFSGILTLGMSKSNTQGTNAIVGNNDELGGINFVGNDGTNFRTAVLIEAQVDGTPGANDMPGRLVFSTTADGASSPTERVRISQNGNVLFSNVTNSVKPAADNAVAMGASGGRWSEIWAANGTIQTSDERAKAEITDATLGADFIKALRPVSYKWVEGGQRHTGEYDEDGNFVYESVPGNRRHWGFIAQEVKEATDAAGVDFGGWVLTDKDDPDSQQALRYDQFIAPLTKALQEALAEIDVLKAKVAALESA